MLADVGAPGGARPAAAWRRRRMPTSVPAVGLALTLLACHGSTTELRLARDPTTGTGRQALRELAATLPSRGESLAPTRVVARWPDGLEARTLSGDGGPLDGWRVSGNVDHGPLASGEVVVYASESQLVTLDARDGSTLWAIERGRRQLERVDDDGHHTLIVTSDPRGPRGELVLVDRRGRTQLRISVPDAVGGPLLLGEVALVPFGEQRLAVIDVGARSIRAVIDAGAPVSHASQFDGRPWLWSDSHFVPLSPEAATGFWLPRRPLPASVPGDPARRTRIAAHPHTLAEGDGTYVATYHRIALGFDATRGALRWVRALPAPVVAVTALDTGFATCDASGTVHLLSRFDGQTRRKLRLASSPETALRSPVESCAFSGDRAPRGTFRRAAPTASISLTVQLADVTRLTDPGVAEVQRLLYRELAMRPEGEATEALIRLSSRPSANLGLQREARDLLATRRTGEEFMLATLAAPASLSSPASLPPLGALADALAVTAPEGAAALLAVHLNHPGYPPEERLRAARALETLATAEQQDALRLFFDLRRTTARDDGSEAVIVVARTLLRVGGPRAIRTLRIGARDPLTVEAVRNALRPMLGPAP